jgi:hypothetical protein
MNSWVRRTFSDAVEKHVKSMREGYDELAAMLKAHFPTYEDLRREEQEAKWIFAEKFLAGEPADWECFSAKKVPISLRSTRRNAQNRVNHQWGVLLKCAYKIVSIYLSSF